MNSGTATARSLPDFIPEGYVIVRRPLFHMKTGEIRGHFIVAAPLYEDLQMPFNTAALPQQSITTEQPKKRKVKPAARKKMSDAQKARWEAQRKAQATAIDTKSKKRAGKKPGKLQAEKGMAATA